MKFLHWRGMTSPMRRSATHSHSHAVIKSGINDAKSGMIPPQSVSIQSNSRGAPLSQREDSPSVLAGCSFPHHHDHSNFRLRVGVHVIPVPTEESPFGVFVPGTVSCMETQVITELKGIDDGPLALLKDVRMCIWASRAAVRAARCPGSRIRTSSTASTNGSSWSSSAEKSGTLSTRSAFCFAVSPGTDLDRMYSTA